MFLLNKLESSYWDTLIVQSDYGNVDDKNASDLTAMLNDTNLQQHVTSATHYRDNILDLVITHVTGSVATDVSVKSLLTDHHIIACKLVSNKPNLGLFENR